MLKGNTRKLGAVGIAAASVGGLLGLFEIWSLAVFLLAISIAILTVIGLVTHRFIVRRLASVPKYSSASTQTAGLYSRIEALKVEKHKDAAPEIHEFPPIGNFISAAVYRGGIGPEYEFAERAMRARGKLETFALRTRSISMRDVFARAASNLHYNAAEVQRILRVVSLGLSENDSFIETWKPEQLLALARVLANQRLLASDLEDSNVIFNARSEERRVGKECRYG